MVSYEGSFSAVRSPAPAGVAGSRADPGDDLDDAGRDDGIDRCAVCQDPPAPWTHQTETPADATLAMADSWQLCDTCHELVVAGDVPGVASRLTLPDLDETQRLVLARRIR